MKPRFDALTWYVMDATADDWESIAQVIPDVEDFLGPQDPAEIRRIILRLFEEGLFEMMPLEGLTMESLQTDFDRCWFSMTTEGRRLWDEDGIHYRTETAEPSHPANPRNAGG
jgi:hypothetical protein